MIYQPNQNYAPGLIVDIISPLVKEGLGEDWAVDGSTSIGHASPHLLKCTLVVHQKHDPKQTYQVISVIDTDLHVRSQVKILVSYLKDLVQKKEAAQVRRNA